MSTDNRATPRINAPLVMVKISTRERMKTGYLKDLSEGGLFVRADKPLPVGREVIVDLLPPGWVAPLRLNAAVVRVQAEPAGMGLKLEETDPDKLDQLKALLKEYEGELEAPPNYQQQLMHLLDQYAELQNTLEQRETELAAERERREESTRRALELSAELEIVKLRGSSDSSVSPKQTQLAAELEASRQEVITLRVRLSELEGALKGTTQELLQLEADEAASRKLATNLAREKAELTQALATHDKSHSAATGQLDALKLELSRRTDELQRLRDERDGLAATLKTLRAEHDQIAERDAKSSAKATELGEMNKTLNERLVEASATASTARTTIHALEARVGQLEAASVDAAAKLEKARQRERELRDLLAMVAKGDEVVVVSEQPEPAKPSPPPGAPQPLALTQVVPSPTPVEPVIEASADDASQPAPWSLPSSSSSTIEIDIDDAPISPGAGSPTEQRIRGNARVKASSAPSDRTSELAKEVASRLATHDRLSDLMVEFRGRATPAQLVGALVELVETGVASVDA